MVAILTATNRTLTSALTTCQLQLVEALQNVAKITTSIANLTAQGHQSPEIGTTAVLVVILRTILAVTAKSLEPYMTREKQNLTQKGAHLEITQLRMAWN